MAGLFDPLTLRAVTLRNRIGVSPMCQYSAEDGHASDWHLVHLGSRAVGGAGLVMVEATAVSPDGRISPGDVGLWADSQIAPLQRITSFLKKHGSTAAIQLAHAGRKASASRPWEGDSHIEHEKGGWETVAPSAIAFGQNLPKLPHELSVTEIQAIQNKFVAAAKRAVEAGFQLIELHGAHGYLTNEFLSPLANKRSDQYGGSFENRVRFALEIVNQLRASIPESMPLAVRLSCTDWEDGGWTLEDTLSLCKLLQHAGVDLIDCSSGFIVPNYQKIPFGAGFQVPFADRIKHECGIATAAVGLITQAMQAEEIIRNGRADLVFLAREFLRNPYWPIEAANELRRNQILTLPVQYNHWLKEK